MDSFTFNVVQACAKAQEMVFVKIICNNLCKTDRYIVDNLYKSTDPGTDRVNILNMHSVRELRDGLGSPGV